MKAQLVKNRHSTNYDPLAECPLMSQFPCNGHHRHAPSSMQSWCVRAPSEHSDETDSLTKQRTAPNLPKFSFRP
jgi:hypothetical protein